MSEQLSLNEDWLEPKEEQEQEYSKLSKTVDLCRFGNSEIWHIMTNCLLPWDAGGTRCGDIGLIAQHKTISTQGLIVHQMCRECLECWHSGRNKLKIHVFKNPDQQFEMLLSAQKRAEERAEIFPTKYHFGHRLEIECVKEVKRAGLTIERFQELCWAFRGRDSERFDLNYWLVAFSGEAGEVLNTWKKYLRGDPGICSMEDAFPRLADEIADTIIYALLALSEMGFKAEDVLMQTHEKVRRRIEAGGFHIRLEEEEENEFTGEE